VLSSVCIVVVVVFVGDFCVGRNYNCLQSSLIVDRCVGTNGFEQ
jgi:hypothetical protein